MRAITVETARGDGGATWLAKCEPLQRGRAQTRGRRRQAAHTQACASSLTRLPCFNSTSPFTSFYRPQARYHVFIRFRRQISSVRYPIFHLGRLPRSPKPGHPRHQPALPMRRSHAQGPNYTNLTGATFISLNPHTILSRSTLTSIHSISTSCITYLLCNQLIFFPYWQPTHQHEHG